MIVPLDSVYGYSEMVSKSMIPKQEDFYIVYCVNDCNKYVKTLLLYWNLHKVMSPLPVFTFVCDAFYFLLVSNIILYL